MNKLKSTTFAVAVAAALMSLSAAGHHSFAMYDLNQERTLTGKLTRFIPGANHAQLVFELVDDNGDGIFGADGNPVTWSIETGPASQIANQGITVKSFPVGTVITVTLNPLRNGRPMGARAGPIFKCGMELPAGGCTAETGESFGGR